jgi:fluoroacetyl-CoA thioesterase
MKETLTVGLVHDTCRTVTKEMSPQHLPVNVLSTPYLVAFVEECCTLASDPYMDEGEATVGTHVCISHDAMVEEGEDFTVRCRLASVNKRRLNFEVEVAGPRGPVSTGTHQRAVVRLSRVVDRSGRPTA